MSISITILFIEVLVKSCQLLEKLCMLLKSKLNQDYTNQCSQLRLLVLWIKCLVFTLHLPREEVLLFLKNKLKVLQTIKSKLIFLFLNLSVSPLILELKPTEKLSHNVSSVTGKLCQVIHLKKEVSTTLTAQQLEREKVLKKKCHSLKTSMINYDPISFTSSRIKNLYYFMQILIF